MILAIRYTVKGVKKGYKKYQAHQLEKEQATKGILPDINDPSCELDATCLAQTSCVSTPQPPRSRSSSDSTLAAAEDALENDPQFQKYMERQRNLYLEQKRGLPPAYEIIDGRAEMAASASSPVELVSATTYGSHCTCHNCVAIRQSQRPISSTEGCVYRRQELAAPLPHVAELDVPEIQINNGSQVFGDSSSRMEDDDLILCEMPGDMPAILPERRQKAPSELAAVPV